MWACQACPLITTLAGPTGKQADAASAALRNDPQLPSTRCDKGSVMIVNYNSLGRRSGVQSEHCMSEVLKGNLTR